MFTTVSLHLDVSAKDCVSGDLSDGINVQGAPLLYDKRTAPPKSVGSLLE